MHGPKLLGERLQLEAEARVRFAGQITGVEGYVESMACGLLVGLMLAESCSTSLHLCRPRRRRSARSGGT